VPEPPILLLKVVQSEDDNAPLLLPDAVGTDKVNDPLEVIGLPLTDISEPLVLVVKPTLVTVPDPPPLGAAQYIEPEPPEYNTCPEVPNELLIFNFATELEAVK